MSTKLTEKISELLKQQATNLNEELEKGKGDATDTSAKDGEFDQSELDIGVEVEKEHTKDEDIALSIAQDHMREAKNWKEPRYYSGLKIFEQMMKSGEFTEFIEKYEEESKSEAPVEKKEKLSKKKTKKEKEAPEEIPEKEIPAKGK
ncbi:MAG: hypothetical protein QXG00_07070 [Candidatus Woesearchaeota archaeon]